MTRLFKSIISTLVAVSLVAVLPAETTADAKQIEFAVEQESNEVFASADVKKKKKKKGKKIKGKGKKKKKGFFSKVFGSK
jgi:ABC-type metal ion transport system substrate-binding protein